MQKDYIMKIVEQFVQAILAIVGKRNLGDYRKAHELVRTTGRYFLKMDIDLLLLYDSDQIVDHFKDFSNSFETEKCVLAADLFYELALIEEVEQKSMGALHLKKLCMHLYSIGIPKEEQFQLPEYFDKISMLIKELKDQPLSDRAQLSLRLYEEFIEKKNPLFN